MQINTGPSASNRLGVIANVASYALYVNGHLMAIAGDAAYVDEMCFSYFVRAATEDGFSVEFEYLAIWLIEEE